jgi:hypothetical protein
MMPRALGLIPPRPVPCRAVPCLPLRPVASRHTSSRPAPSQLTTAHPALIWQVLSLETVRRALTNASASNLISASASCPQLRRRVELLCTEDKLNALKKHAPPP